MTALHSNVSGRRLTAKEIRRLSAAERDAILVAAADQAAKEYRTDPQLTATEAFGDNRHQQ